VAEKVARQCRRFSREALCRAMELLLEADVAIKTGRREARLALEVLVVELLRLVSG
jgi:DNA polymerase III delta subunit